MPEDSQERFSALLEQARRGDGPALENLIRVYEPEIRVAARVMLGPVLRPYLDSMDLVQSVHRTLMTGLRENKFSMSTPQTLLALTATLLRRKIARQWRRMQRQRRFSDPSADTADLSTLVTSLSCPEPDPAEAAELKDQVRHLLEGLDPAQRDLLELRLQGYSTAEAAHKLCLDPDVLRVRLSRLRRRLRDNGLLTEWL